MSAEIIMDVTTNATPSLHPYTMHYTTPDKSDFNHPVIEFDDNFADDMAALLCIKNLHVDIENDITLYHSHEVFGPDFNWRFTRLECLHDLGREQVQQLFRARVRFSPRTCQHLLSLHEATDADCAGYENLTPAVSSSHKKTLSQLQHLLNQPVREQLFLVLAPS